MKTHNTKDCLCPKGSTEMLCLGQKPKKKYPKTSGWNYRVLRITDTKLKGCPQSYSYGIYEVYYDLKDKPISWSSEAMRPFGEDCNGLFTDHQAMHSAFTKKVLYLVGDELIEKGYWS